MKVINYEPKCEKCILGWDEYCCGDFDINCHVGEEFELKAWCLMPKFIKKLKLKRVENKINKYWESFARFVQEDTEEIEGSVKE